MKSKEDMIKTAIESGIEVKESTFGIFNQVPTYSFQPSNEGLRQYKEHMYHVSGNRTAMELQRGIRIMAERMGIKCAV